MVTTLMAWVIPTKPEKKSTHQPILEASGFNFGDCTNLVNSSRLMFPSPWKNDRKTFLPHWEGKTPNFRRQGVKNSSGEHHLEMRSAYIDILYRYTYNNIYIYTVCILYSNKKIYNPIWDRKWMDPRRRCVAGQSHETGVGVGTMDSRPRHPQTKWRCLAGKYLKWWMWNIAMKGKRPM